MNLSFIKSDPELKDFKLEKKTFSWKSPSNIAFIKYWGKKEGSQIPQNPSISMSLSECYTTTTLKIVGRGSGNLNFFYDKKKKESFLPKLEVFIKKIALDFPEVLNFDYEIHSINTFPHSAGIASSASGMSALALCFCDFICHIRNAKPSNDQLLKLASYLSRLGSGSACRSIYGGFSMWGDFQNLSSDEYATQIESSSFWSHFRDTILIVNSQQKETSSRDGHDLMNEHPFAKSRYEVAVKNIEQSLVFLKNNNWNSLGELLEREAFMLHALMMTGDKPFILIKPATLAIIEKLHEFRKLSKCPVYFTLDAGPNLHLIYPDSSHHEVLNWINDKLLSHSLVEDVIYDFMGQGPSRLN